MLTAMQPRPPQPPRPSLPVVHSDTKYAGLVTDGARTDDGTLCTVIFAHEAYHRLAVFPHGDAKLGARLGRTDALRLADWLWERFG
jgi:hypothetical protein